MFPLDRPRSILNESFRHSGTTILWDSLHLSCWAIARPRHEPTDQVENTIRWIADFKESRHGHGDSNGSIPALCTVDEHLSP
jgi:hypothetical protein